MLIKKTLVTMQRNDSIRSVINIISFSMLHGIAFLAMPIITRMLTTGQYGVTVIYSSWVTLISTFVGLQTSSSLNNAAIEFNKSDQAGFRSSAITLSLSFFCMVLVGAIFFKNQLSILIGISPSFILFLVVHAFFVFIISFFATYCTVTMKPLKYMLTSITIAILGICMSILFIIIVQGDDKIYARIVGDAAPSIVLGICFMIWFLVKGKIFYNKKYWEFILVLCGPIIFHSLAGIVLAQSDRMMLRNIVSDSAAGIYSATYSVSAPVNTIWSALNSAWVISYYRWMKEKEFANIRERANLYLFSYTCICCGYIFVSPEIMQLLTPASYWEGIPSLAVLIAGHYFTFMYSFPANHEFYNRKTGFLALATCIAAIINVGLNALFLSRYGIMGAAVITLISNILLFTLHLIIACFFVKNYNYYNLKFQIKGCLSIFATMIISLAFLDITWLRWGLAIAIGVLLLRSILKNRAIM